MAVSLKTFTLQLLSTVSSSLLQYYQSPTAYRCWRIPTRAPIHREQYIDTKARNEMEVLSKTTSESPELISNLEVMKLLEDRIKTREESQEKQPQQSSKRRQKNKANTKFQHRDWIEEQVHAYLQTTPCVALESTSQMKELKSKLMSTKRLKRPSSTGRGSKGKGKAGSATTTTGKASSSATTTADSDATVNKITTGFGLTEAEAIQVLNFMPREPVEIHLMIEELNSRLTETRQEELLQLIQNYTTSNQKNKQEQVSDSTAMDTT